MARKPRVLIEGGLYHVTCRGNERRKIFRDDQDRKRFLERLASSAETHQVRIYLYCLMPNHVHLLVETPLGNLDRFVGSLLTGYTVYFNRRHHRAGHLMQGRYGAQVVEGNEYLLKLSRYIHLNPVHMRPMAGLPLANKLKCLKSYEWSSYLEYTGKRKGRRWLCTGPVLGQMEGVRGGAERRTYGRYVEAGLAETDETFAALVRGQGVAIGSERFVESIKGLCRREARKRLKAEDVAFRQIQSWRSVGEVERGVAEVTGTAWSQRGLRKTGRLVRGLWAWALQRYAGLTQRETALRLGVGTGAAISKMLNHTQADAAVQRWRKSIELLFKG